MKKFNIPFSTGFIGLLPSVLLAISSSILLPLTCGALDKHTPLHLLPPGEKALYLIYAKTTMENGQYQTNGHLQSQIVDDSSLFYLIARANMTKTLEVALDVPYILERKQKNAPATGLNYYKYNSNGLGDVAVQFTYQWFDGRQEKIGWITGIELKLPTGDAENGLGTNSYDITLHNSLTSKTRFAFPYFMATYTESGDGKINSVSTNKGDDLTMTIGLRSKTWKKVGVDARFFYSMRTGVQIKESNGSQAIFDRYNIPGFRIEGRYRPTPKTEFNLCYEAQYPEEHRFTVNNSTFRKVPGIKERLVFAVKLFW